MVKSCKLLILALILTLLLFTGCINNENDASQEKKLLVSCENNDNLSHTVQVTIYNQNTVFFNSTINVNPVSTMDLYRDYDLEENTYLIIVTVDGNWTDSIEHHPSTSSWVSLYLSPDEYGLYIQYKD